MDVEKFNWFIVGWGLGMVTFAIAYIVGEERRTRGHGCGSTSKKDRGAVQAR